MKLKNYILTNNSSSKSFEINKSIISKFHTSSKYCDNYILIDDSGNSTVGILKTKSGNCIVDLTNDGIDPNKFLLWLNDIISSYENLYCVPNSMGEHIWGAFGFSKHELFIFPSFFKLFSTWRLRFIKWGFLNMFFELRSDKIGFKINRKVYYRDSLPKKIYLDTF